MQELLKIRLEGLKSEYQKGQEKLMELERFSNTLRNNLLRISGAIQVLEEELHKVREMATKEFDHSTNSELHMNTSK